MILSYLGLGIRLCEKRLERIHESANRSCLLLWELWDGRLADAL